jgi:hypothetical protein
MAGPWTGLANVGAATQFNAVSTLNIAYPASITTGQPIFFAFAAAPTGQAAPTLSDTDFQVAVSRTTNASTYLFWKIANGTESGTFSCNRGTGSGQAYGEACTFNGGPAAITGNVHATATTGTGATTGLAYPSLTITQPGCLIVCLGSKVQNVSGFNIPADFDAKLDEQHSANLISFVWEFKIQTTAVNFPSGNFTIASDASGSRNTVSAAFLPGAVPPTTSMACTNGVFVNP